MSAQKDTAKSRAASGGLEFEAPEAQKENTPVQGFVMPTKADITKHNQGAREEKRPTIPGSIDPKHKVLKEHQGEVMVLNAEGSKVKRKKTIRGEENLVHVYVTDYGSPRSTSLDVNTTFHRVVQKFSEHDFVKMFAGNFTNDGAFTNVNTAFAIYLICKNITRGEIKERYADKIHEATKNKGKEVRDKYIESIFKAKTTLKMQGTHLKISAKDFLHLPEVSDTNPFGYNKEYKDFFPSNV